MTGATPTPPLLDLIPPRYEAPSVVGQGGMGQVLRARDRERGREVALKLPLSTEAADALRAEYRLLSELRHPGVVEVLDLVPARDGRPLYTMELLTGGPLSSAALPVSPAHAARLLVPLLEALHLLHERGLLHGDLKPENVLLAEPWLPGRPPPAARLADFGLASAQDAPSLLAGTPAYLAPERIDGRPVDRRSDLYSVGALLYELLTGAPPFTGDTLAALARAHLEQVPEAPSRRRADQATDLDEVVGRLLEKEPALRYASASEVSTALRPLAGTSSDEGDPALVLRRFVRSGRFVGRAPLLAEALARLGAVPAGPPGAVMISGAPGSGRSHLLRALHGRLAEAGWEASLVAPASPAVPLETPRQVLAAFAPAVWEGVACLPPGLVAAARRLGAPVDGGAAGGPQGSPRDGDDPAALVEAAVELLRRVPGARRCLLVDAPEGLDPCSRALLDALLGPARPESLAVLVAEPVAVGAAPRLGRGSTEALHLAPFAEADVPAFLGELLGGVDQAGLLAGPLVAATAGHPDGMLLALERAAARGALYRADGRWYVDSGALSTLPPGSLDPDDPALLAGRAASLPPWVAQVLFAGAVLGDSFSPALAAQVAGCTPADLGAALTHLSDEGWIRRLRGGAAAFVSARFRAAARAAMGTDGARRLHLEAARVLTRGRRGEAVDLVVADHLVAAGELEAALPHLRAAAAEPGATLDPDGRLRVVAAARALLPEGDSTPAADLLDEQAADLLLLAGRPAEASARLEALLERHVSPPRDGASALPPRVRWLQKLGDSRAQEGRFAEAIDALDRAWQSLSEEDAEARAANRLAVAGARMMSGDPDGGREAARQAEEIARRQGDGDTRARALRVLGACSRHQGRLDDAIACLEEGLAALPDGASDSATAASLEGELGTVCRLAGRLDRATVHYQRALEAYERLGRPGQVAKIHNNLGVVTYLQGDWGAAVTWWERFRRYCERAQVHDELVNSLNNLGSLLRDRGELGEASARLQEAIDLALRLGYRRVAAMALGNLAEVAALDARWEDAEALYARCESLALEVGAEDERVELARRRAAMALDRGDARTAAAEAERARARAVELGIALEEGNALALRSAARSALGDEDGAADDFAAAVRLLESQGARFELARARLLRGGALLAQDRVRESELSLAAAAATFRDLGARLLLRRVMALQEAGTAPSSAAASRASIRDLEVLLEVSRELSRLASTEEITALVLDRSMELTGSERAFLLLFDEEGNVSAMSARSMSRSEVAGGGDAHSTTVVQTVVRTRRSLRATNVDDVADLKDRRSIVALGLRSVMCAPMLCHGRLVGILYVDSRRLAEESASRQGLKMLEAMAEHAALAVENSRLYEALKHRADLTSVLAHEFRSPLAAIVSSVRLVAAPDTPDDERGQILRTVDEQARRLGRMVNSILDLARLEGGHAAWSPVLLDLREVVDATVREMSPLLVSRGLRARVECPDDVPRVCGSPDRLIQVLTNLLANAARFSPDGGELVVSVRRVADPQAGGTDAASWQARNPFPGYRTSIDRFVEVAVLDQGPGIAPDKVAAIFEKFEQAGDARARSGGTGLGLTISREIVRQHGGRIWAENRPEGGAAVRFLVPELEADERRGTPPNLAAA